MGTAAHAGANGIEYSIPLADQNNRILCPSDTTIVSPGVLVRILNTTVAFE